MLSRLFADTLWIYTGIGGALAGVLYCMVIVGLFTGFVLYVSVIVVMDLGYRLLQWCKRSFHRWIFGGYKLD
jgi:hypothetical protein